MVSTRHHPRPFPEPELPPSRTPGKDVSTSVSSSPTKASASPSPAMDATPSGKRTPARRSTRKSTSDVASGDATSSTTLTRTRSRRKTRSQPMVNYIHYPDSLSVLWLLVSLPLVLWDTGYVLGRPHTMPGGKYHNPIWTPYALYGSVDYMYGWPAWDKNIGFTAAQGTLNLIETVMYLYYLYVLFAGAAEGWKEGIIDKLFREKSKGRMAVEGPRVATAIIVLLASTIMTLSKTILYWLNEYWSGFDNIGHNSWSNLIILWILPNGAWIILPTYMIYVQAKEITSAMHLAGESGEKEE